MTIWQMKVFRWMFGMLIWIARRWGQRIPEAQVMRIGHDNAAEFGNNTDQDRGFK